METEKNKEEGHKVKVRFLRTCISKHYDYRMGDEVELDYDTAHSLFNTGVVSILEPEKFNRKEIKKERFRKKIDKAHRKIEAQKAKPITIKIDNYKDNAQLFYDKQPYFYDDQEMWWIWRENKWEITDDTEMGRMLDDALGFMGQTINAATRTNHLTAMKWIGRENQPKTAPTKWIQFKDKAFSLESKNIYNVKPNYFFTNPIPWELGETEDTPTMDKLFEEWVGKEYAQTLYDIVAYCCISDYPIHLIICLIGCGRNGKSRFLTLLTKFLGQDNVCSTELDTLLDSRFESCKLYKKLLCTMGETNFGVLSKTSLLKKLCGQDMIGFEFKNKKPFDDFNYAKIVISSNSLPSSIDTSEGFYRRWLIIDFPNTFPEGKDILGIIPEQEYNNLARKVTKILPKLLERGNFTNQGNIEERRKRYIFASNPLSMFINEYCKRGIGCYMKYSELYLAYVKYLLKHKKRKVTRKEFKSVLEDEGLDVTRTTKDMESGYFIEGIELKVTEEQINDKNDGNDVKPT